MPAILSNVFKNAILDFLTGRAATSTTTSQPYYVNIYNGAQAADPTTVPAGMFAVNQTYYGSTPLPSLNGFMSAANQGVTALTAPRSSAVNGSYNIASGYATARVFSAYAGSSYTAGALMDIPLSLTGGGGGLITNKTSTSSSSDFWQVVDFKIKMPVINDTLLLGMMTINRLLDNINMITTATPALLTSGTMTIYDGTPPASADLPATGNVLSTTALASTSPWNAASAGSAALGSPISITASATGTATYVRFTKGNYVMQGTVGTASGDFILNSVNFVSGNTYYMTSGTLVI